MSGSPLLLEPGELRHKVQVLSPSSAAPDEFGQPDTQWSLQFETWARIRALSGREVANADLLASQVSHEIAMRFPGGSAQVDASMRITHLSHKYKVQAINNVLQRNITLLIQVLEINESE